LAEPRRVASAGDVRKPCCAGPRGGGWGEPRGGEACGEPCVFFQIDDITHEVPGGRPRPGQHRVPVSAINELDSEPLPSISYLHACVGGADGCGGTVEIEAQPEFLTGCAGECESGCCLCAREQGTAMGHGGARFAYGPGGLLRAAPDALLYECNSACACGVDCRNRIVQRGVCVRLQVFKTLHKGWAVRPLEPIEEGRFVCEYTGEIIASEEAERRGVIYDAQGFSTLFDLDVAGADNEYTIDANDSCGVARFLNHCCEPNLRPHSVWVDHPSPSLPRIAFFAVRRIEAYEELTFDYKYDKDEQAGHKIECQCGAPRCRRWLR